MGCAISYEYKPKYEPDRKKIILEKYSPKEVCPPEQIAVIKERNLLNIKEFLIKQWEKAKQEKLTFIELRFPIEYLCIDSDTIPVFIQKEFPDYRIISGEKYVNVPKKYKNGLDIIITSDEIYNIAKSIINVPHIKISNTIYLIQN